MAESAGPNPHKTEISERSTELVLPDSAHADWVEPTVLSKASLDQPGWKKVFPDSNGTSTPSELPGEPTQTAKRLSKAERSEGRIGVSESGNTADPIPRTAFSSATSAELESLSPALSLRDPIGPSTPRVTSSDPTSSSAAEPSTALNAAEAAGAAAAASAPSQHALGQALPGDRGPRTRPSPSITTLSGSSGSEAPPTSPTSQTSQTQTPATPTPARSTNATTNSNQRPSFWRRIALGRRATTESAPQSAAPTSATPPEASPAASQSAPSQEAPVAPARNRTGFLSGRSERSTTPLANRRSSNDNGIEVIETRVVEPMLQALVSVEAKLERSHSELVGRSDQVEQRLTQLWDIEEQLGGLSELHESLLQVSEQQRRLEYAIVNQTRTTRWLVGAVFFSLAAAAFVVAALLR